MKFFSIISFILTWILIGYVVYQGVFVFYPQWKESSKLKGLDLSGVELLFKEETKKVSDYKGEVLILNFWASWCLPCRVEMPLLASAYNDQKEDKKQIVAVNLKEIWQTIDKFRKNTGIPFSVALDSGELADKLKINVIPSLVVVDREGKVLSITNGFRPWISLYLKYFL